jgi:hypothetical protein
MPYRDSNVAARARSAQLAKNDEPVREHEVDDELSFEVDAIEASPSDVADLAPSPSKLKSVLAVVASAFVVLGGRTCPS